jgi:hypothetical protein
MSDALPETTSDETAVADAPVVAPADAEVTEGEGTAERIEGEVEQAPDTGAKAKAKDEAPSAESVMAPRLVFPPCKLVMLVEPDGPVRGSVAEMARSMPMVNLSTFSSVELGEEYMKGHRIQALLLSVGEGAEPMEFLARLRRGECPCDADIPVVVMAPTCDAQLAGQLKEYGVSRLLIEPFKLGDMAHTLEQLWEIKVDIPPQKPAPEPEASPAEGEAESSAEAKPEEASSAAEDPAQGADAPQTKPA